MANKIVLISDDSDFFEYTRAKLELRKSDELFMFAFDNVPEKIHLFNSAVLIINSESSKEKTLDLLNIVKGLPVVVMAYNDDDTYRRKCYRAGVLDFMTVLTPDAEFRARMIPVLGIASLLEKNNQYRKILVKNNLIATNNEVFLDYNYIIDKELEEIHSGIKTATFAAIAPNDKTKFLLQPEVLETILLNNIRKNDILMNYAPNKYFLFLFDTDLNSAQKFWAKISQQFPQKVYAGFIKISNQKRQQLINEVLNKLHIAINYDKNIPQINPAPLNTLNSAQNTNSSFTNFKLFKQEFGNKMQQVITPVFYQIQQKYANKFINISINQTTNQDGGIFILKGKHLTGQLKITSPGFSKINIDISFQKNLEISDSKRISLNPEELESGLIEDILEQFILEYTKGLNNDY